MVAQIKGDEKFANRDNSNTQTDDTAIVKEQNITINGGRALKDRYVNLG